MIKEPNVDLDATLLALEEAGWQALSATGGDDFYRSAMTDHGMMVFPGMALDKPATIDAIRGAAPWSWFKIEEPRVIPLTEDAALLVYRARAQRPDAPEYRATMTTGYVRKNGEWRVAFHRQSPF